jgi:hypothetical protein
MLEQMKRLVKRRFFSEGSAEFVSVSNCNQGWDILISLLVRVDGILSVPSLVKHRSVTFGIEWVELMEIKKSSVKEVLAAGKIRAVEEQ